MLLLFTEMKSGRHGNSEERTDELGCIHNVSSSRYVVFESSPQKSNGIPILVCPGGGYTLLDWDGHVTRLGSLLNPMGFTVIGLAYRTSPPSTDTPNDALEDLYQVLKQIEANARRWEVDPEKIVAIGYSAGANLLLQYICSNNRSGWVSLKYIAMLCLWNFNKTPDEYTPLQVPSNTWFCSTFDDTIAPISFSEAIATKLDQAGSAVTSKKYESGGHLAFNFKENGPAIDWTKESLDWLSKCRII